MRSIRRVRRKRKPWRGLESFFPIDSYHTLDATAGLRRYWKGRNMQGVLFLDIRAEVKPDIVASNEYLPFRPGVFNCIFYDPPHIISRNGSIAKTSFGYRYGFWTHRSDIIRNIYQVNEEFARVLRPRGKLLFFYTDYHENPSLESCLSLLKHFRIIQRERLKSKAHTNTIKHTITLERLYKEKLPERL